MLINKIIRKYYNNYYNRYGDSYKSVRWSSEETQKLRFNFLIKVFELETKTTINDLGCGLGDLVNFIDTKRISYYGYDLSNFFVNQAKETHPKISEHFFLIDNVRQIRVADYTIASGIFNDCFWFFNKKNQKKRVFNIIEQMWNKSRKGIAFNFLTPKHKKKYYDGLLYFEVDEMIKFCIENLSPNVYLFENYTENDATLHVLKLNL